MVKRVDFHVRGYCALPAFSTMQTLWLFWPSVAGLSGGLRKKTYLCFCNGYPFGGCSLPIQRLLDVQHSYAKQTAVPAYKMLTC